MFNLFINPFVHCKNPLWIIYTAKIEAQISPCNVNSLIVAGEIPNSHRETPTTSLYTLHITLIYIAYLYKVKFVT